MSTPGILANMARGWSRDPAGVALGSERTGVCAALWTHGGSDTQEVWAEPDPALHMITVPMCRYHAAMMIDGKLLYDRTVTTGGLQLVRAGERPRAVLTGPLRVLHVYLRASLLHELAAAEELVSHPDDLALVDPECAHDPVVERIGRDIVAEMGAKEPLSRLKIDTLGQDLAIQLLRHHSSLRRVRPLTRSHLRGGLAPWQVRRISDFLDAHLANDVSLADLGELLGLSTFHFCRAFKQSTGLPPYSWLVARRVDRARILLETTDRSIGDIAAAVGYEDPNQLARVFRKIVGRSPSQYRRERMS